MCIRFAPLMIAVFVVSGPVRDVQSASVSGGTTSGSDVGQSENSFTISVPSPSLQLKQGDTKAIYIAIKRGGTFGNNVSLRLEELPAGITIEPNNPQIGRDENSVKVTLRAGNNAAVGNFAIKVVGHPVGGGRDAVCEFKLTTESK